MFSFNHETVEKVLSGYFNEPKIESYLNKEGEQIIHLRTKEINTKISDINLAEIDPHIKKSIQEDEGLFTKMIIIHYSDFYKCYTMDIDQETMRKNLKYLRMMPDLKMNDPYVEVLDLKFQPSFYVTSFFRNFHIKIENERLNELEVYLKSLHSDALDVAKMNMERGFKFKVMKNDKFPNILTEQNHEPLMQLFLFPKLMENLFANFEDDEIILKFPNMHNIAFLSYQEFKKHPEKLKDMNGYPTLYIYKKGEGLTIFG